MPDSGFRDRRVYERIQVKFSLRYLDLDSNREGSALTRDISANGIGMLTQEELSSRSHLEIWLQIPDRGEPLYTKGEVVWSRMVEPNKYRSGVCLDKIDFMAMSRIIRLQNIISMYKSAG
ncbi:PilZ domain-containing protein [Candidatus Omnitrophota bacterium]